MKRVFFLALIAIATMTSVSCKNNEVVTEDVTVADSTLVITDSIAVDSTTIEVDSVTAE